MRRATALRMLAGLAAGLSFRPARPALGDDRLLLVVGANSHITALNSLEVRKLFLGLTVIVDERRLRGLRNESDEQMRLVFFQNIVSMSESVYDRRMLAMTLQQGRATPRAFDHTQQVFDVLADDADAVSYAWSADVQKDPRVKALRVLWHP